MASQRSFPAVDLRVELHDAPEAELRRLWDWFAPMVPLLRAALLYAHGAALVAVAHGQRAGLGRPASAQVAGVC